jgi:hypothetical protein
VIASLAAALLCVPTPQSPQVDRALPAGAQRGTEVAVVLTGQRLASPQGLLLAQPGLEVLGVASEKPEQCTVRLRVAADCALGVQPLRLRTALGLGNLVLFDVGTLPEIIEKRDGDAPQAVPFGCTINGTLGNEETDRYVVDVAAGAVVQCEVQALRLGQRALDLALVALAPDGSEVARADDTAFGGKDPLLSFAAATAGKYTIAVRAAWADAQNTGVYRLHVGGFPRPTVCMPCGGAPGEALDVQLLGDAAAPGATAHVVIPPGAEDPFAYFPEANGVASPTPLLLRVGGPPNKSPAVDDKGHAWVDFPASVHGVVADREQPARFHWHATKGAEWEFRCLARAVRSPLDPVLVIRDKDNRSVANNDDGNGLDSVLRFTPPADGDYVLEVRDLLRRAGPTFCFRLEGAPRREAPSLRMVLGRREDAAVVVARGNRAAAVLQWNGLDPKDARALAALDLPAGVAARFGPVRSGTNLVPVVFTAEADAPLAGSQVALAANAPDATLPECTFVQPLTLVTTRNDQPLFAATLRRLPVAVTESAPFTLQLEPPAVPIVRGAPLSLAVKVVRAQGFSERITLKALWNPPGVGSGQVNVEGDTATAAFPLSADGNALTGRMLVAVVGEARWQGGSVAVCTDFAELQVDEPWLTATIGEVRTEPGKNVELPVTIACKRELAGPCRARLLGLPRGVQAEAIDCPAAGGEVRFALQIAADAAVGRHRSVLVQILAPLAAAGADGAAAATVEHRFGGGELRIDAPLATAAAGAK